MGFLAGPLGFIPSWAWRFIAIAVVAIAFGGWCYMKGINHQEAIDEKAFAQIRAEQDELAIHAGRVALDRSQAVSSIVATYEAQHTSLATFYAARLRDARARSAAGTVPANPLPPGAAAGQPDGVPAGCEIRFAELEGKCAETTARYKALREAAKAVERIQ